MTGQPAGSHGREELTEDEIPAPGLTSETLQDPDPSETRPGTQDVYRALPVPATHDQTTRKTIALIILFVLCGLYVLILGTFLLTDKISETALTSAIASVSGLQALAAAAVGFYYGAKQGG